ERTYSNLKKKWHDFQDKLQKDGVKQRFADFDQEQKRKAEKSKALSNVSQWIKEITKGDYKSGVLLSSFF
ncbi:hypothetical protein ACJBST_10685, partial [Streptococcus suis]